MDYTDEEVEKLIKNKNFPILKNDRILKAAWGHVPDKLPVWIMRQAGRYLSEFQALRKEYDFFTICETPKLACEVTMMPLNRYDLDAAIIFSDILVIPKALGMNCIMEKLKGPVFPTPLKKEDITSLKWDEAIQNLQYVANAITLTRHKINGNVPLIGFSAAPWTLMVYMIEGGSTKTASQAKKWLYQYKNETTFILNKLTNIIIDYIVMQVDAGAQLIQIFESSAEYLNKKIYKHYMVPCLERICSSIKIQLARKNLTQVPLIFFAKGGGHLIDLQSTIGFNVLGIDWITEPDSVRKIVKDLPLQGNLDPCALYMERDLLVSEIEEMLNSFGYKNYIVNLGHGIYPDTPPEAVTWFVDQVHDWTPIISS